MPTAIVRTPVATVTWAGNLLTQVTGITVSNGLDQRVAECRVTMPVRPGSGGHMDSLVITAGASSGTSRTIFNGVSVEADYQLWPRQYVLVGRGQLYRAVTYVNHEGAIIDGGAAGCCSTI
jgi:hypothetical protein